MTVEVVIGSMEEIIETKILLQSYSN